MTRSRIITALTAMGLTALTLSALPGTAQASGPDREYVSRPAAADTPVGATANGYFYAYENEKRGGKWCRWEGNDGDWSTCTNPLWTVNLRNQASSLQNSGYPGSYEDVNVYWDVNYGGAWYCVANGRYIENIVHFYFPRNGSGGGQSMNDNISSHRWSESC